MDAPLALYRRYRPETFAEVIGQDHVTGPLRAALAANRVNHAYLFSGPRGCGKTTSARILARALNCERAPIADPCGECDSCRDLARGGPGSIDVIEIDAASHGGVDDARDLREKAYFAPVRSRYKVYIIDEAHMVTTQGFNALLKLVEEPPEHLRFIFATTEPDKVIPTIRSRTHHYPFRLIPPKLLGNYLQEICQSEGVQVEPTALPLVVRAGAGSARDTLSVMDQLLGGAGPDGVTYDLAAGLLGYTPDSLLDEVVDAFAAHDGGAVFAAVDKVIETGQDPRRFTEDLLRRLRDLLIIAAVPDASATGLIDVAADQAERLSAQARRYGAHELSRAADLVAVGLTEMRGATAPRLLLELVCARVLLPGADHGSEGLAARLDRLERRVASGVPGPAPTPETPEATADRVRKRDLIEDAAVSAVTAVASASDQVDAVRAAAREAGADAVRNARSAVTKIANRVVPDARPEVPAAPVPDTPTPPEATKSGFGVADVRRLWPDVIEQVKGLRRMAWIHLSQNSQVVSVADGLITLGFPNAGARDSFLAGKHDEVVRDAASKVLIGNWRIEAIVDGSTVPIPASGRPEPEAAEARPEPRIETGPSQADRLKEAMRAPAEEPEPPVDLDSAASPDDDDFDGPTMSGTALLEQELGAQLVEEFPHQR
jgi:DNA polymerase-3 subunit gamma/tau